MEKPYPKIVGTLNGKGIGNWLLDECQIMTEMSLWLRHLLIAEDTIRLARGGR